MTCRPCAERRRAIMDAYLNGKIAEAVRLTASGVKEMVGLKKKDGENG